MCVNLINCRSAICLRIINYCKRDFLVQKRALHYYRPLNKFLIGSKFDNPTPFQSVRSIPKGMKFFTVVDALKGYHQCALDTESMSLTTFATPEGLHQYTRLPMGISHAGDDYGRRFSDIFGHIPNTAHCMEDLVIYSRTYEEHINLLRMLFKTANDNNVSFNKSKTVFSSVRSMLEAEDSAMSEIMAILDVKVCGPSPSSSEGAPGKIGERESASASTSRFPGIHRAVKLYRVIWSRNRRSRGLSSLSKA